MLRLSSTSALCALAVMAAPAAAQEPDWSSELNRTWWNGVTSAELQELTAEAGGVWTDIPDTEQIRVSRIDWPDLPGVMVREVSCPAPERPMPERNCGSMLLSVRVDQPADIEAWWLDNDGWLAFGRVDSTPALYRLEHSALGTTRGHVLSTLMLFRDRAVKEIDRIEASGSSGW
ncbi:hypothetical protein [Brevundimonas sp. LjRoot202]|uniref:hypothetical protein n=1 Tax=Brevundimonas sp. LjRoot202 TaxID=3342281 RepID=UPI003ECF2241